VAVERGSANGEAADNLEVCERKGIPPPTPRGSSVRCPGLPRPGLFILLKCEVAPQLPVCQEQVSKTIN
jgi:hypothetical protein